jgi:hypothetical protein
LDIFCIGIPLEGPLLFPLCQGAVNDILFSLKCSLLLYINIIKILYKIEIKRKKKAEIIKIENRK